MTILNISFWLSFRVGIGLISVNQIAVMASMVFHAPAVISAPTHHPPIFPALLVSTVPMLPLPTTAAPPAIIVPTPRAATTLAQRFVFLSFSFFFLRFVSI